jgi:hypothetical protein
MHTRLPNFSDAADELARTCSQVPTVETSQHPDTDRLSRRSGYQLRPCTGALEGGHLQRVHWRFCTCRCAAGYHPTMHAVCRAIALERLQGLVPRRPGVCLTRWESRPRGKRPMAPTTAMSAAAGAIGEGTVVGATGPCTELFRGPLVRSALAPPGGFYVRWLPGQAQYPSPRATRHPVGRRWDNRPWPPAVKTLQWNPQDASDTPSARNLAVPTRR